MTTLDSVEAELAAAHEAAELHREVVILLTGEISKLKRECDRALACEAAALGLLPSLRARLAESEASLADWRRVAEADRADSKRHFDRAIAAEARLSAATRVVEAAGALEAVARERWRSMTPYHLRECDALRAALREWKEGSK
ncbi:MAG: hypothetical protein IPO00_08780 [Betaproteobacteria bacterium]|nr:hypothetical protein [Betaproteobacteria bacterium]